MTTITSSDSFSFSGLQVVNVGTFLFQATLGSFSGFSESFDIAHKITTVSYTPTDNILNAYKAYDFVISIADENGDAFTTSSTVSLSLSDLTAIGGYSQGTTSTGIHTFSDIYFQKNGAFTLSIIVETTDESDTKTFTASLTINKASLSFQSFTVLSI